MSENIERLKIISATGQVEVDKVISTFNDYDTVATVDYREDLLEKCLELKPDILLISDIIGGKSSLLKTIMEIKSQIPTIRIIYFCGKIDYSDTVKIAGLNLLIASGIYDIIEELNLEIELLAFILKNPRPRENVKLIEAKYRESLYAKKKNQTIDLTFNEDITEKSNAYPNVYTFISYKGGTGKSFLVSNIAIALATSALSSKEGQNLRIGIVDLDFVGFGVSHLFDLADKEKNIMNALNKISLIINRDGDLSENTGSKKEVIDNVQKMFISPKNYSNIKILGASTNTFDEKSYDKISQNHIAFLINAIANEFDILLVDVTSDIKYDKIFPLFDMSRIVFDVMDMDLNSFNNVSRAGKYIEDNYIGNDRLKHICNKVLSDVKMNINDVDDYLNFNLLSKIPYINPSLMFNITYDKQFVINNKDKSLLFVRYEILKIANIIYPIKNFEKLSEKIEVLINEKDKKLNNLLEDGKKKNLITILLNSLGFESSENDLITSIIKDNDFMSKLMKNINKTKSDIKLSKKGDK